MVTQQTRPDTGRLLKKNVLNLARISALQFKKEREKERIYSKLQLIDFINLIFLRFIVLN